MSSPSTEEVAEALLSIRAENDWAHTILSEYIAAQSEKIYTKADVEALCALAVAGVEQHYKAQSKEIEELRRGVYADIKAERQRQDEQWGGASHDDGHNVWDWNSYRKKFERRVLDMLDSKHAGVYEYADGRIGLIKIAALAVAQIESLDRSITLATPPLKEAE